MIPFNDVLKRSVPQSEHNTTEEATDLRRVSDGSVNQDEMNDTAERNGGCISQAFVAT